MKKSIDFFYRVAKEAGFAEDEDGNPSDCYLKIGFNLKKPVSAEKIEAELDTHVGSASSLVACRNRGYKYVGFEINRYYFDLANKRLKEAEAQWNIFDYPEAIPESMKN